MSAAQDDPATALPAAARARLDRFAAAFQGLDTDVYGAFSAASLDPEERREALVHVQRLIGDGPRRAGILAALGQFREYAVWSATNALGGHHAALLTRSNTASAEERLRFLASLELSVVSVILWDEIEPDEREAMLGPWHEMATRAVAEVA
ncbi:MAG: hypothetical protein HY264_01815 [Chloroflexi bacterium]|nr:hypothetical protein [Chloroflexota bacterium]